MIPAPASADLVIAAFQAPRDPALEAWGRQVPALLHRRLAALPGVKARLAIDPPPSRGDARGGRASDSGRHHSPRRACDLLLEGAIQGGPEVALTVRLSRGPEREPVLEREDRFGARELFQRLEALAADVARALGLELPPPALGGAQGAAPATSWTALRDYLRAMDLSEEPDLPLELEDRRRKLEWLLLAVEADPSFAPAADALLEAGLRAHESGLTGESRHALELLSRMAPRDPRATYVLGELALAHGASDEASAYFRRCLARDPQHAGAAFRLGLLADQEGDREAAKAYFRTSADAPGGRAEALLLYGILCAEDGEREAASRALARASALDPEGRIGSVARFELERALGLDEVKRALLEGVDAAAAVRLGKQGKVPRRRGGARRR